MHVEGSIETTEDFGSLGLEITRFGEPSSVVLRYKLWCSDRVVSTLDVSAIFPPLPGDLLISSTLFNHNFYRENIVFSLF